MPGAGERILHTDEYWYQPFHRLPLSDAMIDGDEAAVRTYLAHFWEHWSAPGWAPTAERFDELVALYARPGAFTASIAWYRSGSGGVQTALTETTPAPEDRIALPTTVLWPEHDPLFPFAWSDRLGGVLRGLRAHTPRRRGPLLAAGGARADRRGYGPGSTPVTSTACPALPTSIL